MIVIETIGKAVPEKPMVEPSPESATLETPRKDERPPEPRTPLFTPPPKPASTTPIVEPPPAMIEKAREAKEGSLPEKKPVSSEESFVEVTLEEGEINETGPKEVKDDAENEGYLSGSLGPSDSEGSIDGTDEEDEDEDDEVPINEEEDTETPSRATSMDPTTVPLPVSRSPSVAPEVPSIVISTDPTQKPLPVQEISTTPSGTPAKPETTTFSKPASTTPVGQPSSIGFGRPNTRPTRSSPLAGAPVIGQDRVEGAGKDVEESKTEVVELQVTSSSKPSMDLHAKAVSDGDVKAPTPQTSPSLSASSSPTLKPAVPIPGVPPKLSSASATPPFMVHKVEPPKSRSMFGGVTGLFGGSSSQRSLAGSPPTTETQATPPKLPFSLKADGGTPSPAAMFGASLARPVSSPLTLAPAAPSSSELNRPASVPPSNFFAKPLSGSQFSVKGPAGGSNFFGSPSIPAPAKTSPPEVPLEEGIQKECALLYNTMNQELEEVSLVVVG